jgi:hypothetical protein
MREPDEWSNATKWKAGVAASLLVAAVIACAGLLVDMQNELQQVGFELKLMNVKLTQQAELKSDIEHLSTRVDETSRRVDHIEATRFSEADAERFDDRLRQLEQRRR